jgi:hypothetical protein
MIQSKTHIRLDLKVDYFLNYFFIWKYIKIIYIFLKIIFNISTSNQSKNTKRYLFKIKIYKK